MEYTIAYVLSGFRTEIVQRYGRRLPCRLCNPDDRSRGPGSSYCGLGSFWLLRRSAPESWENRRNLTPPHGQVDGRPDRGRAAAWSSDSAPAFIQHSRPSSTGCDDGRAPRVAPSWDSSSIAFALPRRCAGRTLCCESNSRSRVVKSGARTCAGRIEHSSPSSLGSRRAGAMRSS